MTEQKLKELFDEWYKSQSKDGYVIEDWVKSISIQGLKVTALIDFSFTEKFETVIMEIPETYPSGVYKVSGVQGLTSIENAEDLDDAFEQLFEAIQNVQDIVINSMVTNSAVEPESSWDIETPTQDREDFWSTHESEDELKEIQEKVKMDIETVNGKKKGWYATVGPFGDNQCWIYLFFDPTLLGISRIIADAWGLDLDKFVVVALKFSHLYTNSEQAPTVSSFQSGDVTKGLDGSELNNKSKYGLYWTVENVIKRDFFEKYWPLSKYITDVEEETKQSYLYYILNLLEDTLKNSAARCLICGGEMPYEGIRPTVCNKQICIFGHEQYGLGLDLETYIIKYPDLLDLMISMCYAACTLRKSQFNPFNPYPDIEIKTIDPVTKKEKVYSLVRENKLDNSPVREVLDKMPDIPTLTKWIKEGKLKENLDKEHPLAHSLLQWLIASNRTHLKRLTKDEQIKEMNTEYQYYMCTGTPEKEKQFQELKSKYGTSWGFHGSATCNWHAILRMGLKNMTGTDGQLNGAAYGSGVYLAPTSQVSFDYIRFSPGWPKSERFAKGMGMMALCEIIKHPDLKGQPNPYYVVKNDNLLATRYFFIYKDHSQRSNVNGSTFTPPPIKW